MEAVHHHSGTEKVTPHHHTDAHGIRDSPARERLGHEDSQYVTLGDLTLDEIERGTHRVGVCTGLKGADEPFRGPRRSTYSTQGSMSDLTAIGNIPLAGVRKGASDHGRAPPSKIARPVDFSGLTKHNGSPEKTKTVDQNSPANRQSSEGNILIRTGSNLKRKGSDILKKMGLQKTHTDGARSANSAIGRESYGVEGGANNYNGLSDTYDSAANRASQTTIPTRM